MSRSGVTVNPDCITKFNELKLGKSGTIKYIIYKLSSDFKEVVVETESNEPDYEKFREYLVSIKAANGKAEPRYAVYDFVYELDGGEGIRNKIIFISWSPDDAGIKSKMVYASSKETIKLALNGVSSELQANDEDDLEYATILSTISKGKR